MNRLPQILIRPWTGALAVLGGGAAGGYAYRLALDSDEASQLNSHTFVPFTLTKKNPVSSTSSIFTMRHHELHETKAVHDAWERGVWSVQAKQPQLQIARAYTPLPKTQSGDNYHSFDEELGEELRLLIRREEGGEVSSYLHKLPEQSTVELRGPYVEMEIPERTKEVLFLAGGTGIAPAMQVASLLAKRKQNAKMHILWANRHREDCLGGKSEGVVPVPPGRVSGWRSLFGLEESVVEDREDEMQPHKASIVQELERLKKWFGKDREGMSVLNVEYFVDDEKKFIQKVNVLRVLRYSRQQEEATSASGTRTEEEDEKKLILISGPDGFIEHWAGKKVWVGGHEGQGSLGGILSELNLKGWKVWKL